MTNFRQRVLLINPNRMKPAVAPIGLDYLASAVRRAGFDPHLFDMSFMSSYKEALRFQIQRLQPLAIGISVRNIDDCYYASQDFMLPPIQFLVRHIKGLTESPVVLGGVGFSIAPDLILDYTGADYGIRGDGEVAFPLLLKALAENKEPEKINGLHTRGMKAGHHALINFAYGFHPDRDFVDNEKYFKEGGQGNIETKRGCNRHCIYCADPPGKGTIIRCRPVDSVVDELELLAKNGIHTFHFCDSEFNIPARHAIELCQRIIRRGLDKKIKWYTYMNPYPFPREMARLMARAGCAGIDFGADSGSDLMLRNLGRDYGAEQLIRTAKCCRDFGIVFMYDLLLGGPGETRDTLQETIGLIKKIRPHRVGVSLGVRILPNTPLARMIKEAGPLTDNPNLVGTVKGNDEFLEPVFYMSKAMDNNPGSYLRKLIDDDPIFLFADPEDPQRNYNYNDNRVLVAAIKKGMRGAYWDILRRISSPSQV